MYHLPVFLFLSLSLCPSLILSPFLPPPLSLSFPPPCTSPSPLPPPPLPLNHGILQKALSDSPYSVTYLGSEIKKVSMDVHVVLIEMELYEGLPVIDLLNQYLSAGQSLSEDKVMKIFTDVCQAVARLHHRTKPILHRDLKVGVDMCKGREDR